MARVDDIMEKPAEHYLRVFPLFPIILIWVMVGLMLRAGTVIYKSPEVNFMGSFGMYIIATIGIAGLLRMCFIGRAKITPEGISFPDFLTGLRWRLIPWHQIRTHELQIVSLWRTPNLVLYLYDEATPVGVVLPYVNKKEIQDFVNLAGHYIHKAKGLDGSGPERTRGPGPRQATEVNQPVC